MKCKKCGNTDVCKANPDYCEECWKNLLLVRDAIKVDWQPVFLELK